MSFLNPEYETAIRKLASQFGIVSVKVFGSRARGSARADSDLDLLVRFEKPTTLVSVIGFKQALEETLRIKVDVVEEGGLSPYMRDRVVNEAIAL